MIAPYQQAKTLDPAAREQMILEHLPQVRYIASRILERLPKHVALDDLVSAGILGLISAVDNFDDSRSVKLRTYAEHKIRGHILNSLGKLEGTPRTRPKQRREVQQAIAAAEQRLGATPDSQDIADQLGISVDEYHELLNEMQGISLGTLETVDSEEGESMLRYIADPGSESPSQTLEKAKLRELLANSLNDLPHMERLVLSFYYLEGLNLRQIADIVDLHMTRISQLKTQAILRLRSRFEKLWPGKVTI